MAMGKSSSWPTSCVLGQELDGPVVVPVHRQLGAAEQPEAVLEPDLGAAVEAEEVLDQIHEVALAERPREAVGDAEAALVPGQPQRRRQADQGEVGLGEVDVEVGVVGLAPPGRRQRRRWRLAVRPARAGSCAKAAGTAASIRTSVGITRRTGLVTGNSSRRARRFESGQLLAAPSSIQRRMTEIWPSVRKGPEVRGMRIPVMSGPPSSLRTR